MKFLSLRILQPCTAPFQLCELGMTGQGFHGSLPSQLDFGKDIAACAVCAPGLALGSLAAPQSLCGVSLPSPALTACLESTSLRVWGLSGVFIAQLQQILSLESVTEQSS